MSDKVYIAREQEWAGENDPFATFQPPFDLEADMLFALTGAPTRHLARRFPDARFLDLGGTTPLILWFSRIHSLEYGDDGRRKRLDEATGFGYNELNVVATMPARSLFVPVIHADGDLTQALGHRYGMPKRKTPMTFAAGESRVESTVQFADGLTSRAAAKLLASGRILGKAFDLSAPWWTWPARFPDGSLMRAQVRRVPRAQLAQIVGELALDEPWLPEPRRLWPLGLYVPRLAMRLPAPPT